MSRSKMTDYLQGKTLAGEDKKVAEVRKKGDLRTVVFTDGSMRKMRKAEATMIFNRTLAANQKVEAKKNIKVNQDGSATVKIGGQKKGQEKTYKNERGANIALGKIYGR